MRKRILDHIGTALSSDVRAKIRADQRATEKGHQLSKRWGRNTSKTLHTHCLKCNAQVRIFKQGKITGLAVTKDCPKK